MNINNINSGVLKKEVIGMLTPITPNIYPSHPNIISSVCTEYVVVEVGRSRIRNEWGDSIIFVHLLAKDDSKGMENVAKINDMQTKLNDIVLDINNLHPNGKYIFNLRDTYKVEYYAKGFSGIIIEILITTIN